MNDWPAARGDGFVLLLAALGLGGYLFWRMVRAWFVAGVQPRWAGPNGSMIATKSQCAQRQGGGPVGSGSGGAS